MKHKPSSKILLFFNCKSNLLYNKDCATYVAFSWPILALNHAGFFSFFSLVACTPRKVMRHMTSRFGICEIGLDMQIGFLNAAPCTKHFHLWASDSGSINIHGSEICFWYEFEFLGTQLGWSTLYQGKQTFLSLLYEDCKRLAHVMKDA